MEQQRPNLIYVFPDELRQQALGFMQQDPVVTPNIDRFASESLVLSHAFSSYPVCSPYRAMLLTGQYSHSNGVLTNCNSDTVQHSIYLDETTTCFSDVLQSSGYSAGYIGKWHLDPPIEDHARFTEGYRTDGRQWDAYTPPGSRRHGFDFWYSYGCCDRHLRPHYWTGDAPIEERIDVDEWSVKHETDIAINYLQNDGGQYRNADNPFALFISYNPPHMPFNEVPPQYLEPYEGLSADDLLNRPNVKLEGWGKTASAHVKNYFAAITGIDEQFGRILDCLDETGLSDNTIVVFTSDHGEMMGSHGLMEKSVYYDESFRVPFIIRLPGKIAPGEDNVLLNPPDIMPTLLSLMGTGNQIPESVEGRDLSAILLGQQTERPDCALYLVPDPLHPELGWRGVRTHRYMFAIHRSDEQEEQTVLFDCEQDPYQLRNIATEQPSLVAELRAKLDRLLETNTDPWRIL